MQVAIPLAITRVRKLTLFYHDASAVITRAPVTLAIEITPPVTAVSEISVPPIVTVTGPSVPLSAVIVPVYEEP